MKQTRRGFKGGAAFTLIEMLVVIAIIGILSSLIYGSVRGVLIIVTKKQLNTECHDLELKINRYKAAFGSYPPDNPENSAFSPLVYEVAGAVYTPANTLLAGSPPTFNRYGDGSLLTTVEVAGYFSPANQAFNNSGRNVGEIKLLQELSPERVAKVLSNTQTNGVQVFQTRKGITSGTNYVYVDHSQSPAVTRPWNGTGVLTDDAGLPVNVWHYRTKPPLHNPGGFDLWTVVLLGNTPTLISNWQR